MELRYYIRMLLRGWWLILLTMLISLDVALIYSYLMTPVYSSSIRLVVSPNLTQITGGPDVVTSIEALDKRSIVNTYAEFLNSESIFNETLKDLNLKPEALVNYKRSTVVLPDSNVLELSVEGMDPNVCAMLANSLGQRGIQDVKNIYQVYDISMLDTATPSILPIRPVPLRDAGLALVLGLVIGSGLAILREQVQITMDSYRHRLDLDRVSTAYNRNYLQRRLDQELARKPNGEVSFGMVRLDGIQDLINTLPHTLIQELLREVTATLRKELRGNDMIGRWDDITFAVLLPTTTAVAANRTMERICTPIAQPINLELYGERIDLQPRMSIVTSRDDETMTHIIQRVEDGLNMNWRPGKNPEVVEDKQEAPVEPADDKD